LSRSLVLNPIRPGLPVDVYQQLAEWKSLLDARVLPRVENVRSVSEFGAVGDDSTDNSVPLRDAVEAIGATPGTLTFPPGTYAYTDNQWLKVLGGAKYITLKGPAKLRCTKSSASGPEKYALRTNSEMFDDYGYPINTVAAGATQVVTQTAVHAGNFAAAGRGLVYGQPQQQQSFPPNCRWFEFVDIDTGGGVAGTGVTPLGRPLKYKYRSDWYDDTSSPSSKGKARILSLDRGDFVFGEKLVMEDLEFLENPNWSFSQLLINGFRRVELRRVKGIWLYVSCVEQADLYNCTFLPGSGTGGVEWDKFVGQINNYECDYEDQNAANGVEQLNTYGGRMRNWTGDLRARRMLFTGVDFTKRGSDQNGLFRGSPVQPVQSLVFVNNRGHMLGGGASDPVVNGGAEHTITAGVGTSSSTIKLPVSSANFDLLSAMMEGFTLTSNTGVRFRVTDIYQSGSDFAIDGEANGTVASGDTLYWPSVQYMRANRWENDVDGTFGAWRLYDRAAVMHADEHGGAARIETPLYQFSGASIERYLGAGMYQVVIDVQKAYTGSSATATIIVRELAAGLGSQTVNLKTAGLRIVSALGTGGAVAGDTLTTLANPFAKQIEIIGNTTYAGTASQMADVFVRVEGLPRL
jgi:hypothetical protein